MVRSLYRRSRVVIRVDRSSPNLYYDTVKTRRALAHLTAYTPGERKRGAIKLSSNENPLGCSPHALTAIRDSLGEMRFYPDGAALELKRAIADRHRVEPDQVIIGNGSDEILTMIAAAYLDPGDRVLVGAHTFSQYAFSANLFDAEVVRVPMPDLRLDPSLFGDVCDEAVRIVYLCSPNNPTGLVIAGREFAPFLERTGDDRLVVVDHAYQDYVDDQDALAVDALFADGGVERYPDVIVLHTFSKVFGLASQRVGYAIAARERIAELEKVRSPFNVNTLGQIGATAALGDAEFHERSVALNRSGKKRMYTLFTELKLPYLETHANFVTIEVSPEAKEIAREIGERGVTVRSLASFGLPHHVRITIGTPEQIDRLEMILRELFTGR